MCQVLCRWIWGYSCFLLMVSVLGGLCGGIRRGCRRIGWLNGRCFCVWIWYLWVSIEIHPQSPSYLLSTLFIELSHPSSILHPFCYVSCCTGYFLFYLMEILEDYFRFYSNSCWYFIECSLFTVIFGSGNDSVFYF